MSNELINANAAALDGFDAVDPAASPIRGTPVTFKKTGFHSFKDPINVANKQYLVLDKACAWQRLAKGMAPEFVVQRPGEPRPPQPSVAESEWPIGLNGDPEHPFKWTVFLTLLDAQTGEISTFSTSTAGGNRAVADLQDQIGLMRSMQPSAVPVVAMEIKQMPTGFGPVARPHFRICGWRQRGAPAVELPALTSPMKKPTTAATFNDELPF